VPSPETASVPLEVIVSMLVYQPLGFGPRLGLTETEGSVASYFNENGALVMFPARS
jgi:hypothetical protein